MAISLKNNIFKRSAVSLNRHKILESVTLLIDLELSCWLEASDIQVTGT